MTEIRKFAKMYIVELYQIYILYQNMVQLKENTSVKNVNNKGQKFSIEYILINLFNSFTEMKPLGSIKELKDIDMFHRFNYELSKNAPESEFEVLFDHKTKIFNIDRLILPAPRTDNIDDVLLTRDSIDIADNITVEIPYPVYLNGHLRQYRNYKKDIITLLANYNENNNGYNIFTELSYINDDDIYNKIMELYSKYIGKQNTAAGAGAVDPIKSYKHGVVITTGPFKTCANVDEITLQFNSITDNHTPKQVEVDVDVRKAANQVYVKGLYDNYVLNTIKALNLDNDLKIFRNIFLTLVGVAPGNIFLSGGGIYRGGNQGSKGSEVLNRKKPKSKKSKKNKSNNSIVIHGLFTSPNLPNTSTTPKKLTKTNLPELKLTKKQNLHIQKSENSEHKKSKTILQL